MNMLMKPKFRICHVSCSPYKIFDKWQQSRASQRPGTKKKCVGTPHRCFVVDPNPGRSNAENRHLRTNWTGWHVLVYPAEKPYLIEVNPPKLPTKCDVWPFWSAGSSGKLVAYNTRDVSALWAQPQTTKGSNLNQILFSGALNGFRTKIPCPTIVKSEARQNRNNDISAFKHPVYTQHMFKSKES
jgi:hypothetical protein